MLKMNSILELLKEIYLIDNLLSSTKLDQKQVNELNIKINKKFSRNKLNELNKTLSKFNKILIDETDKNLQNMDKVKN